MAVLHVDGMRGTALIFALVASQVSAQTPSVWRLTPELRVGGPDKGEEYEFTRIARLAAAANGSLYVFEFGRQEVRVFDGQGRYVRTIGRRGGGPGEFRELVNIGLLGDTLWTIDRGLGRVSFFADDGKLVLEVPREVADQPISSGQRFFGVSVSDLTPGGLAMGTALYTAAAVAAGLVPKAPVLLLTRGGRTLDTLAWLATKNSQMAFKIGDGGLFALQRFSDSPISIMAPAARRLLIVDRSVATSQRNAMFRVTALGLKRDTIWSRSYSYVPKRLEAASVDSQLAANEKSWRLTRDRIRAQMFIPEFRTPIASGFAAPDGSLWLKREDGSRTVDYTVIAPNGNLVATLTLPRNVTLRAVVGDTVWGVETDADDVPSIVRYRINGSRGQTP